MTADGAAHLAEGVRKIVSLATLILRGNRIGDCGAWGEGGGKEQEGSSTLTTLNFSLCEITAADAPHLAEGVRKSLCLATLILYGNKIGDGGPPFP